MNTQERNYVDSLRDLGSNFENLEENSNFETEMLEVESLERNGKISGRQASAFRNALMSKRGHGVTGHGAKVEAQFSFKVKRLSNELPFALPVPFFGSIDRNVNWAGLFALPTGVRIGDLTITADGDLLITYQRPSDGAQDQIILSCTEVPYICLLENMISDVFALSKMRINVSDVAQISQFNNSLQLINRSLFGNVTNSKIGVSAFKSPYQNQSNIIDVDGIVALDKSKTLLYAINPVTGLEVQFDSFVAVYDSKTAHQELSRYKGRKYGI